MQLHGEAVAADQQHKQAHSRCRGWDKHHKSHSRTEAWLLDRPSGCSSATSCRQVL